MSFLAVTSSRYSQPSASAYVLTEVFLENSSDVMLDYAGQLETSSISCEERSTRSSENESFESRNVVVETVNIA